MSEFNLDGYKLFSGGNKNNPRMSIRSNGMIAWNKSAASKCNLDIHESTQIYYNNKDGKIAMLLQLNNDGEGNFKIHKRKNSWWINASNFFINNKIKLPLSKTGTRNSYKYHLELVCVGADKYIVFDCPSKKEEDK